MTKWAIQQADERWLAPDYGWTAVAVAAWCFELRDEAAAQADRIIITGTACHVVAAPHVPDSSMLLDGAIR